MCPAKRLPTPPAAITKKVAAEAIASTLKAPDDAVLPEARKEAAKKSGIQVHIA